MSHRLLFWSALTCFIPILSAVDFDLMLLPSLCLCLETKSDESVENDMLDQAAEEAAASASTTERDESAILLSSHPTVMDGLTRAREILTQTGQKLKASASGRGLGSLGSDWGDV